MNYAINALNLAVGGHRYVPISIESDDETEAELVSIAKVLQSGVKKLRTNHEDCVGIILNANSGLIFGLSNVRSCGELTHILQVFVAADDAERDDVAPKVRKLVDLVAEHYAESFALGKVLTTNREPVDPARGAEIIEEYRNYELPEPPFVVMVGLSTPRSAYDLLEGVSDAISIAMAYTALSTDLRKEVNRHHLPY